MCENNGGNTDYYKIQPDWKMAQDIIESRGMNFAQGNILKAAFCFNTPRHSGTNYERELNKIIWFCERELKLLRVKKQIESGEYDINTKTLAQKIAEDIF